MVRSIALLCLASLLAAGCSSSSSSSAPASTCKVAGTYAVTFTTLSGDCGTLGSGSYTFTQSPGGDITGPVAVGSTMLPGSFDSAACDLHYGWTLLTDPKCAVDQIDYSILFTAGGFLGTADVKSCNRDPDAGAVSAASCTGKYEINGTRQ